jgi:hypothetical protein
MPRAEFVSPHGEERPMKSPAEMSAGLLTFDVPIDLVQ